MKRKITLVLLSVLLLAASTASVRSSLAQDAPAAQAGDAPDETAAILTEACCGANTGAGDSAAFAAEELRWEAGYISQTTQSNLKTRSQRLGAAFSAAERLMQTSLQTDWAGWNEKLTAFTPDVYDSYAQNVLAFSDLAQSLNGAVQSASAACARGISRDLRAAEIPLEAASQPETTLGWRECAALYYVFGEGLTDALAQSFAPEQEGSAYSGVALLWPNPSFEQIAACGTHDQLVEAVLALDYFNTVYNDDGSVAPVEVHVYSKEYLATVAHPVPGGLIKDGWYDPRSHRTRLHVGTDIRRNAKTPILAATDGVVKYIGYLPIPGYYVMIEDPYGYTYHYYHMYELTTFVKEGDAVKQGQQIGIVGSTGNSVAYHLHLGLVSPEGKYLNPYDLFVQAGIGPILEN
ncbi:MAG: M23 family metallopeptidase [Clostridiales bacterium]|nr:M23 family metallopeptidase [Clostridiales bacterium]